MSLNDAQLLELHGLCHAVIDGIATEAQVAQLNRWLSDSEEARQCYVRITALSASLFDIAGEMQSEEPEAPIPFQPELRSRAWLWGLAALATAALVVLAFRFGLATGDTHTGAAQFAEQEPDEPIAHLSASKDCQWAGLVSELGDELKKGQRLELISGFAEITFDSGAQLTMEGPAVLELHSAWEALLQKGLLKASVPPEAIGFRVSNPSVEVVDLGTEFSMVAEPEGATEVFVLKGSVEAAARDGAGQTGPPMILHTRQSRRFARGGAGDVSNSDKKLAQFLRKIVMERVTMPAGYVHWSFDDADGARLSANTIGIPGGKYEAQLLGSASPAYVAGKWGRALALNGDQFARADFPGINQRNSRTVAFWVNIPTDALPSQADSMISWQQKGARGAYPVNIGWNRNPSEGAFGALRTDFGAGYMVGATPLRDGRWHHLAVVISPKRKTEASVQVRQYVDGRLEDASDHHPGKRAHRTLTAKGAERGYAEEALWIGCSVENSASDQQHLVGALDELFVADRALSPQEIRHLMKKNAPAPAETVALE